MKIISNSKLEWPESLIGQIDPDYNLPIVHVRPCNANIARSCLSAYSSQCKRIRVSVKGEDSFDFLCNIIPGEEV